MITKTMKIIITKVMMTSTAKIMKRIITIHMTMMISTMVTKNAIVAANIF
ncbi:MAG: hypothetical protein WCS34_08885 [Bacteroidales bacterium]